VPNKTKPAARLGGEFFASVFQHIPDDTRAALAEPYNAGRVLSTENESLIRTAHDSLGTVLDKIGQADPEPHDPGNKHPVKSIADVRRVLQDAGMSRAAADAVAKQGFRPDAREEPGHITPDPRDEAGAYVAGKLSAFAATVRP
jgi:hypothetical protein